MLTALALLGLLVGAGIVAGLIDMISADSPDVTFEDVKNAPIEDANYIGALAAARSTIQRAVTA